MIKIYHNPRCSKSRETLSILTEKGVQFEVIDYLKDPLTLDELETLHKALGVPLETMVRTKEEIFPGLEMDLNDPESVFMNIIRHPILLERPIVIKENKAVIGRPPENVLKLFN